MGVKADPVALILFSHIPPYLESSKGSGKCPKLKTEMILARISGPVYRSDKSHPPCMDGLPFGNSPAAEEMQITNEHQAAIEGTSATPATSDDQKGGARRASPVRTFLAHGNLDRLHGAHLKGPRNRPPGLLQGLGIASPQWGAIYAYTQTVQAPLDTSCEGQCRRDYSGWV